MASFIKHAYGEGKHWGILASKEKPRKEESQRLVSGTHILLLSNEIIVPFANYLEHQPMQNSRNKGRVCSYTNTTFTLVSTYFR